MEGKTLVVQLLKKLFFYFSEHSDLMQVFFYMYKYIYVLKQEGPEMDEEKNGSKGKVLMIILEENIGKIPQNIFAYSFVSEHSKVFLDFEKKLAFLAA